ncbi:MAG: inner membrane CreD family protein [Psychrobacter sp.]
MDLPLAGISNLNTVPTGSNFKLSMQSNWHAPNFIGKALPNTKDFSAEGFTANWQNQYLTVANNQYLSQCLSTANNSCTVDSRARLDSGNHADYEAAAVVVQEAAGSIGSTNHGNLNSVRLNSFGVSFAEPNDVYLQTERTMKYALLLILISFGTFFLFEVIKSSRIHPIQYLLVGCALLTFYVLLLPLAEQIAFWQAYAIAGSSCVGLIGWYTYYVLGGVRRAVIFTAILAGLYAAFYGILTTEDLNLLLGAVFCFILLACVMVMTRKIDWYKIA